MEAQPVYTALLCRQQSLLCAEQGHPKMSIIGQWY